MATIHLHEPTTIAHIDQTLCAIIAIIEQHFPDRVRSYYLVGSYAVGAAVPASDIDIIILFKDQFTAEEAQRLRTVRDLCAQVSPWLLGLSAQSETTLMRIGGVWFQTASRCLYGEDIRQLVPRKPVQAHLRDQMHAVYPLLARVRDHPPTLTAPLDYPDPTGAVYGYDQRQVHDGTTLRSVGTKDLVTNALAIASVLTLRVTNHYVGSGKKADIPEQYKIWVNDEWTVLVEELFWCCRMRWNYTIPTERVEQNHLRSLCQGVLAFENHFLTCYRGYLLEELQHPDEGIVQFAVQRLGQLIYPDMEIITAIMQLRHRVDTRIVDNTLQQYRTLKCE